MREQANLWALGEVDVTHFLTHQILDYADFGNLIGSADTYTPNFLI